MVWVSRWFDLIRDFSQCTLKFDQIKCLFMAMIHHPERISNDLLWHFSISIWFFSHVQVCPEFPRCFSKKSWQNSHLSIQFFSGQNKTFVATWRDIAGSHLHAISNDWSTYTNPKILPLRNRAFLTC